MIKAKALCPAQCALNKLRIICTSKEQDFVISLRGRTNFEKNQIKDLFEQMYGIITELRYSAECEVITGRIASSSKAQIFLTGQYLEIAIAGETREIVGKLAEKWKKDYHVFTNVIVSNLEGINKNEFDIAIEFDKILYVIEVKSGKNFRDYDKYVQIGREYKIVPGRFLLVNNYLSEDMISMIEYFSDYYVCNVETGSFEKKLVNMIENDMNCHLK